MRGFGVNREARLGGRNVRETSMGKWWTGVALLGGWLAASAAADAQPSPAPGSPPAPPAADAPPTAASPTPPGGYLPPPQGNFSVHAPVLPPGVVPPPPGAACPVPATPPPPPEAGPSAFSDAPEASPPNAFTEACDHGPTPLFHVDLQYLAWWTRHQDLPVLVTSGSFSDAVPGALGQPTTQNVVSGEIDDTFHSGVQLMLRWDLGGDHDWVAEVGGFTLGHRESSTTVGSDGGPNTLVLVRPFFNANTGTQDADPIAVPNVMSGRITIQQPQDFYGADLTIHSNYWWRDGMASAAYIVTGVRFLELDERLLIGESLQDLPGLGAAGNSYALDERFSTFNRFYGGVIGLEYVWNVGPLFLKAQGRVGLGYNQESLGIAGSTQITDATGNVTTGANRALLVQPSNAGTYNHNVFAAEPEVHLTAAYDVTQNIRIGAGYDFMYLTNVLRPGQQVDPTINIQALQPFDQVGPARPGVFLNQSTFWAQGVNFTLEFSY